MDILWIIGVHVDKKGQGWNKLHLTCHTHTHTNKHTNSVQILYSSGLSAKYSLALNAAAINFNLVWITMATA